MQVVTLLTVLWMGVGDSPISHVSERRKEQVQRLGPIAVLAAVCLYIFFVIASPSGLISTLAVNLGSSFLSALIVWAFLDAALERRQEREQRYMHDLAMEQLRPPLRHFLTLLVRWHVVSHPDKPTAMSRSWEQFFDDHYYRQLLDLDWSRSSIGLGGQDWLRYSHQELKQARFDIENVLARYRSSLSPDVKLIERVCHTPLLELLERLAAQTKPGQFRRLFGTYEETEPVRESVNLLLKLVAKAEPASCEELLTAWNISEEVGSARLAPVLPFVLKEEPNTMPASPPWKVSGPNNGIMEVTLASWADYDNFLRMQQIETPTFIFRGQADAKWRLSTVLDRKGIGAVARSEHLQQFRKAVQAHNLADTSHIRTEDEWWTLGQHYYLSTPLLEWSASPFVAAFFAYADATQEGQCAAFCMNRPAVQERIDLAHRHSRIDAPPPVIQFVEPVMAQPHVRRQFSIFTKCPPGVFVDDWVQTNFKASDETVLIKINLPAGDRELCLKDLTRMGIDTSTLFADMYGISRHLNLVLSLGRNRE